MTATSTSSSRWSIFDRALLVVLVLANIPGIPGVGIETRTFSDALLPVYAVVGLAPIVALAASWRWPLAAGWVGLFAGLSAAAVSALDLGSLLGPPPPPGMIVVDAIYTVVGLAVAWRSWRMTRR